MARKIDSSHTVILIGPRFPHSMPTLNIPVGLLHVGSYLVNEGYMIMILDANNFKSNRDFLNTLKEKLKSVSAVGLSVMTNQVPSALEISDYIKQLEPSLPVIWGGVHPSLFPEQTARCRSIDFIVRGEGEITMLELLKALAGQIEPESVKGIAFKSNNHEEVIITEERGLMDLNELPPVRWELLENLKPGSKLKLSEIAELTGIGIYLQTSRGCPYRCTFCINSVLKSGYRYRRSDLVLKDIQELVNLGVDKILFIDDIVFVNKKIAMEILGGIEKLKLKFKWIVSIRADFFNERHINLELISKMKQNGCLYIGIGAESGSQRILDMIKKDITIENTINAAQLLNKVGMRGGFSFMVGLPGEEKDDISKTLQLIVAVNKIDTSFSFRVQAPQVYRPYPGSELYFECLRQGMKQPAAVEEWASSPYIRSELFINPDDYPWIKHNSEFINNVVFYGGLSGIYLRYQLLTRIIRKIASFRCERLYFKYPIEKIAYDLYIKSRLYKLVRLGGGWF